MNMNERFLAEVSWPPSSQTVYVRLLINRPGDLPLSVKATFRGFSHRKLAKGDRVEVERTDPKDARRYRIVHVCDAVPEVMKEVKTTYQINVRDVDEFRRHQAMTMSKDRVRFFIGYKYFNNVPDLLKVLQKAFDIRSVEGSKLINSGEGFWIICRPSQFARFMIFRNAAGIQNGFIDLRAELVSSRETYGYEELAEEAGCSRDIAKRVAVALGFSGADVAQTLRPMHSAPAEIDVSGNPA